MQLAPKRLPYAALLTVAAIMALSACGQKNPSTQAASAPTASPAVAAAPTPQPPAPVPPVAAPQSGNAASAPASIAAETAGAAQVVQNTAAQQPGAAAAIQPRANAPLGTSDFEVTGVEVTLLELKRTSGDTLTARWRYRNTGTDTKELTKSTGWTDSWRLAWDSYLIDGVNKKKYLLLKGADGMPIAAAHGSGSITLGGGQTLNTWAKYPAPPEDVQKVSLYLPGVAPFEDVPISK